MSEKMPEWVYDIEPCSPACDDAHRPLRYALRICVEALDQLCNSSNMDDVAKEALAKFQGIGMEKEK